jgi:hypothetical protein
MFNIFKPKQNIVTEKLQDDMDKKISRRGFLFKAAGAAAAIGYGKLGLDFLNNPEQKEKVFSEISRYFGEMSMEARLEQEVKDFYNKYGISLDLKSLQETNKIKWDQNDLEIRRLELIKRKASEVYGREVSKRLGSATDTDMKVVNEEYEKMMQDITNEYAKENPLKYLDQNSSTDLNNFEKLQLVEHLKEIFALYPADFIRRLKVKTINAGRDPLGWDAEKNIPIPRGDGGYALRHVGRSIDSNKNRVIYLDFSPNDYVSYMQKRQQVFSVTSHELSHMKDNENTNDDQEEMLKSWAKFNGSLGSTDYMGDYYTQLKYRLPGYADPYGSSKPEEDRATIAESLWSAGLSLQEMCKTDKILAAKVSAIKQEYFEMDSRFNEEYWTLLREGKMQEVQNHVRYNVKK